MTADQRDAAPGVSAQVDDPQVDAGRAEARRRFGRLPDRVPADELVESHPQPPPAEQGFDPAQDAVRRFGLPL
jgi:hypothetical protein